MVIGTGLPGLAVASELRRRGVDSIIVDGLDLLGAGQPANTSSLQRCDAADGGSPPGAQRNPAAPAQLRREPQAGHPQRHPGRAAGPAGTPGGRTATLHQQWAVHTPDGVLLADHIVLTRCAHSQLRRMLSELGMAVGQNLVAAMHAIGMYLVGVGELITPTPKEVLRQAKVVGQAISAKVYPDSVPALLPGGFRPRRRRP